MSVMIFAVVAMYGSRVLWALLIRKFKIGPLTWNPFRYLPWLDTRRNDDD